MSKSFSPADVAAHKTSEQGMYIIIDEGVYDVTGSFPFPLSPSSLLFPSQDKNQETQANQPPSPHATAFKEEHPGGSKILTRVAGKDATKQFWKYHNEGVLKKYAPKLQVGVVEGKEKAKL
ncbi:hypothetical protein JHW43_006161 [Diplocarpon mali]|nr:hypothetical protein JHW43_006161 [Diplocarpon mali]